MPKIKPLSGIVWAISIAITIEAYQIADDLDPESVSLALRSRFRLLGDFPVEEPAYL
jgi:hypothetical protein